MGTISAGLAPEEFGRVEGHGGGGGGAPSREQGETEKMTEWKKKSAGRMEECKKERT
jgi:hypothetical protein